MRLERFITLWFLATAALHAESPQVIGFERFHRDTPTASGGAVLFSELGCANCHGGSEVIVPRKGPNLIDLSKRVEHSWATEFLQNPGGSRKGTTMPSMFDRVDASERKQAIADVLEWLRSHESKLNLRPSRHVNAERGSALFHETGCVACHAPTADVQAERTWEHAIALPNLQEKTGLTELAHFLTTPARYRTDGRMPHLELDAQEAVDVAAHLLDFQASDPREAKPVKSWPKLDAESLERGKAWVEKLNCAACHDLGDLTPAPIRPITEIPNEGTHCLSENPSNNLPRYDLDEHQLASLKAFLESGAKDPELTLTAMNCYACHDRDRVGGPVPETNSFFIGDEALGDSGRLPPPLTGVGHKLKRDWLESVFAGKGAGRVRPYLKTRMPAYAAHGKALADWLQTIDEIPDAKSIAQIDDLELGRKLVGTQGGMNCIICHQWGEKRSLGIQAMDIRSLDQRLRPEWFRTYLLKPSDYRPATLMPPLWPIANDEAEDQIGAIWAFIRDGEGLPPGFPDHSSGEFELVPKDRPIVQRTFLKDVGTKAILVGFPAGIHLAFDGEHAKPALIWRGQFFDAYNTWFSRAAPFEAPLEADLNQFSASDAVNGRFLGYELDEAGNPTFLSRRGELEVSERFQAHEGVLTRTLHWAGGEGPPEISHPSGVKIATEHGDDTLTITYSWK